jgi:hypothetical protein
MVCLCDKLVLKRNYILVRNRVKEELYGITADQNKIDLTAFNACRFEVLIVVTVKFTVIWDVIPCSLLPLYQTTWCHIQETLNFSF